MLGDAPPRKFTADEVLRMVDAGILAGEPARSAAPRVVGPLHQQLERAFGAGFHVQDHAPRVLADDDAVEVGADTLRVADLLPR